MPKPRTKLPPPTASAQPTIDAKMIDQVSQWAVSGATEFQIREAIAATFPAADPARLLAATMTKIAQHEGVDPRLVAAWSFEAGRELYRRMVEANDFAGALKALRFLQETARELAASRDPPPADV